MASWGNGMRSSVAGQKALPSGGAVDVHGDDECRVGLRRVARAAGELEAFADKKTELAVWRLEHLVVKIADRFRIAFRGDSDREVLVRALEVDGVKGLESRPWAWASWQIEKAPARAASAIDDGVAPYMAELGKAYRLAGKSIRLFGFRHDRLGLATLQGVARAEALALVATACAKALTLCGGTPRQERVATMVGWMALRRRFEDRGSDGKL